MLAAEVPEGFSDAVFADGLVNPTAMAFAPDGRLFVAEQGGQLRVVKDGELLETPFLSLSVNSTGERGLLGVAFDPSFSSNQHVYVYYTTADAPIHNRVSRFTADGDVAEPGSELVIVDLDDLTSATNHNGGAIHFGPDGRLYIATGENATGDNAQTLENRLGKILRINKNGTIPTNNPFFDEATDANRAIWAMGLRNPFTFAFQPGTGLMLINDVGGGSFEEVNEGEAGANYGWPVHEGPGDPPYVSPLYSYPHTEAGVCAITGGAFYESESPQFPSQYEEAYFFADLCAGWIRVLDTEDGTATEFATGVAQPVDLDVGDDGSLYYLSRGAGLVGQIRFDAAVDADGDGYADALEEELGEDPDSYCAVMRADVGDDGTVSILDLTLVAGAFGQSTPPASARLDQGAPDVRDGAISILDLSAVAGQFGKSVSTCP